MAVATLDPDADLFEATTRQLDEWGGACRSRAQELGLPTISNFATMSEHVRRQERDDRKARRERLRARVAEQRRAGEIVDSKDVAQLAGFVEPELTARGKHTDSMRSPRVVFSSSALIVEAAVRALPKWMQSPIYRTHVYLQPHRIAAFQLRMDESEYRSRWKMAVREVGRILAMREAGAVKSNRPHVRVECDMQG